VIILAEHCFIGSRSYNLTDQETRGTETMLTLGETKNNLYTTGRTQSTFLLTGKEHQVFVTTEKCKKFNCVCMVASIYVFNNVWLTFLSHIGTLVF
jgi:hypothetical protein